MASLLKSVLSSFSSTGILILFGSNPRFKDSAESETSRPSRIRLGPLRDEFESRVGRLNSEETDSAENRSQLAESRSIRPSQPSRLRFSPESVSFELSRLTRDSNSSRSGPRRIRPSRLRLGRVFEPW